jgi:hypothetical protein
VQIAIEKLWVIDGAGDSEVNTHYQLTLYCDAAITGGEQSCQRNVPYSDSSAGPSQSYESCKVFTGNGSHEFTAHVIPQWPSTHCWVDEDVYEDGVEIDNGCKDLIVSAGHGASCRVTNTVFFEGIPTLSRFGLAMLALLMLGMGMIGFRRFA